MDGALGSRGAALIEPYDDDPTNRGLTMMSESTLTSIVIDALKNGIQVCVHSIGDRANHIVLDAYEKALKDVAIGEHRLRIEHVQILDKADVPRFKKLGVIPAMQPVHCTSDMYWVAGRIGEKRSEGAYAWRSLLETGVHIAGGSDFPVEYPNPLFSIYAAVTRQDQQGVPRNVDDVKNYFQLSRSGIIDSTNYNGGWFPSQKMTREEAIRSFTIWAAEAGFEEKDKGSLEKGKLADFVVLSKDIMTIPVMEIWGTEVEMTVVGGELKNH
jgi:predicted amidohydrolase YtcJ